MVPSTTLSSPIISRRTSLFPSTLIRLTFLKITESSFSLYTVAKSYCLIPAVPSLAAAAVCTAVLSLIMCMVMTFCSVMGMRMCMAHSVCMGMLVGMLMTMLDQIAVFIFVQMHSNYSFPPWMRQTNHNIVSLPGTKKTHAGNVRKHVRMDIKIFYSLLI